MSHFREARRDVEEFFSNEKAIRARVARVCVIWDLQGRLRLLVEPAEGQDARALAEDVRQEMSRRAAPFWTGEVWLFGDANTDAERTVFDTAWARAKPLLVGTAPPEVRVLERHVSKDSWFVPGVAPPWPLSEHSPPVLAFYSFKGGVGRTTALLSLGILLARTGKRVALVDLDLEAPGLLAAVPPPEGVEPAAGVLDYLLERPLVDSWNKLDMEDFYYTVDRPEIIGAGAPLTVIPAGRLDEAYLEKVARVNYEKIYALAAEKPDRSPFVELLKFARSRLKADYVLIDSRAGFHDIGGLALSGSAHLDVIFGLDSEQSWRGLEILVRFLGRDRVAHDLNALDCLLVLAMAPPPGAERGAAFERFKERAHDRFLRDYYEEEGGDETEVPALDDEDAPHHPALLGFDPQVQRYQSVVDVADRLMEGDYRAFAERVLARVGRGLL